DRGELRLREVHVVMTVSECLRAGEESLDLRVATRVAATQDLPLRFRQRVSILAHDRAGLRRKIWSCAHQHHGLDTFWLPRGHVQQDVATAAYSERLTCRDSQAVEQRKHVRGGLIMSKGMRQDR